MKLKGHKFLLASGATAMIRAGLPCWRPSAGMFFGLNPNPSATTVMLRGRDRFADHVERTFGDVSLDGHQ